MLSWSGYIGRHIWACCVLFTFTYKGIIQECGRLDDQIALLRPKLFLIQLGMAFNGKRTKTARSQGKKFQVSGTRSKCNQRNLFTDICFSQDVTSLFFLDLFHFFFTIFSEGSDQMADRSSHSRYVKLKKDQAPVQEVSKPGELYQPIDVPQVSDSF